MKNIRYTLIVVTVMMVSLLLCAFTPSNSLAGTPHTVWGALQNSDTSTPANGTVNFTAYIQTIPGEIITQDSPSSEYQAGSWFLDLVDFPTGFANGDVLVIAFQNTVNHEIKEVQVVMDSQSGSQQEDVTLEMPALLSIAIAPVDPDVTVPDTEQFTAMGTFEGVADPVNITNTVTWVSSDTDKGTIPAGLFTSNYIGTTDITAEQGDVTSNTSTVTVLTGPADTIAYVLGDAQTKTVGTILDNPFVVKVTDAKGNPVSATAVTFAVTAGGGTLSVENATTGTDGTASSTLTLGITTGANTVTATSTGLTGSPVTLNATGTAGAVSAGQSTVDTTTPVVADGVATSTITITAKDQYDNLLQGKAVTLFSTGSDNTLSAAANTDASGQTTGTLASTKAETKTVSATIDGVAITDTASVVFNAGNADKMTLAASKTTLASGGGGTSTLTATIFDAFDNLVNDDTTDVTFTFTDYQYLTLGAPQTVKATDGVATLTVTTAAGTVPEPPPTTDASITSAPALTPPGAKTLTIVNFSIDVTAPAGVFVDGTGVHLVTSGSTPSTATFSGEGGTVDANYRWALGSAGSINNTGGKTTNYTAPATITPEGDDLYVKDTLTLTYEGDDSLTDTIDIYIYNPLAITSPTEAIGIALGDTSYGSVGVSGGTGTYKFQSSDTAVATVNADTGAITPVAVGNFTVQVRDATYGVFETVNGFYAVSPQIEIVDPITVLPATKSLEASGTQDFDATGGKAGGYTWTCSNADAGAIASATGIFSAAAVTATQTTTITATDGYDIEGTATVTVYATVEITNKPTETPTIESGATSTTYTVEGGDDTLYTWLVTGPVAVTGGTGASYAFVAPSTGAFAGVYTITVTDNQGFTDSFKVNVPIKLTPDSKAFTETKLDGSANPQTLTLSGADGDYTWEILDSETATSEVDTPADYGTWSDSGTETEIFAPADVDAVTKFYVRVTVTDDVGLTEDNGLNKRVFGPFNIIPVDNFTVTVSDSDEAAISGANVSVDYIDPNTSTPVAAEITNVDGEAVFILPDAGGTYSYTVTATDKVSQEISSASKEVTVTLEGIGDTITGTVEDTLATAKGGATVTAYQPSDLTKLYQATTAGDGSYTINLPVGAALDEWTVVVSLDGFVAVSQADQAVDTAVNFTGANGLQAKTTIGTVEATVVGTDVQIDITASPAFAATSEASVAKTSETGTGSLGVLSLVGSTIRVLYNTVEDFTVVIKADTSEDHDPAVGYYASRAFSYVAGDTATATAQVDVEAGSSGAETVTANLQTTEVEVPVGGLTKDATIVIKQVPKDDTTSTSTQASPCVLKGSQKL